MDFGLKNSKFVPEIDEVPINPHRLREIIEELAEYNLACRLYENSIVRVKRYLPNTEGEIGIG